MALRDRSVSTNLTRGLQPGLIIIGARPSMGKTAFALGLAWNAAQRDETVAFFSVEMSRQELLSRLVSAVGRIDGHRLASGYVPPAEYEQIGSAFAEIGGSGLHVDDSSTLGVLDVLGKARRLKARRGLHLVVATTRLGGCAGVAAMCRALPRSAHLAGKRVRNSNHFEGL